MAHPISGPISPEELMAIADLPYGKAAEALRKHDPHWGKGPREEGETVKYRVFVTQQVTMEAYVLVDAVSEEDALDIVAAMKASEMSWDHNSSDDHEPEWAEPA